MVSAVLLGFVASALAGDGPVVVRPLRSPGRAPGCAVRFEWQEPGTASWIAWEGPTEPASDASGRPVEPPHRPDPTLCWHGCPEPGGWRIVDGEGRLLTGFAGPYAVDARPLARVLGERSAYRAGRRAADCRRAPGLECWTALELWLYLDGWQRERCAVDTGG